MVEIDGQEGLMAVRAKNHPDSAPTYFEFDGMHYHISFPISVPEPLIEIMKDRFDEAWRARQGDDHLAFYVSLNTAMTVQAHTDWELQRSLQLTVNTWHVWNETARIRQSDMLVGGAVTAGSTTRVSCTRFLLTL